MSRVEVVRNGQVALNKIFETINGTDIDITQEQLTNLNLSAIASQLAEISTTLAIIADKLGG